MASEFVYYRTYSRWVPELNRRETYPETVARYIEFMKDRFKDSPVPKKVYAKIEDGLLNKVVMPSMRTFWSAGESLRQENISGYNCSALAVDSIESFAECLYILCCGTGVGFSVERKYVNQLPEVPTTIMPGQIIHVVADSKEGWAESLKILMTNLYSGNEINFDYSKVRPAGARLKTFGGRASGPGPLISLHSYVKDVFYAARGRKLTTLECHDIMNEIAQIVVSGGVRRSSEISLSDLDDDLMRGAKVGNFPVRRYMANNSAVFLDKPTSIDFLKEWTALAASGTGERGIFNLGGARKNAPERRDATKIAGVNPCQPAYATVLTPSGISTIGEIKIGDRIWSGTGWTRVVNKWSSGIKSVNKYTTTTGHFIGTENHRVVQDGEKVEVGYASKIDWCVGPISKSEELDPQDIMDGLVIGDGSVHKASNNLVYLCIGRKDGDYFESEVAKLITKERPGLSLHAHEIITTITHTELPKTYMREVPDRFLKGSTKTKKGFLRGLFTANGTINGNRVCLKQASRKLIDQVQLMLSSLGIHSYITTNKGGNVTHHNGECFSKESYDINITSGRSVFRDQIGFIQRYKQDKIIDGSKPMYLTSKIKSIDYIEDVEVFDITVDDDAHTYWSGGCLVSNCGEVMLRLAQFCNLSEVVIRPGDDLDSVLEKVETATWIGVLQSCLTKFNFIRKIWKDNCDEERLLGVSLTGQMDVPQLMTPDNLKALKSRAIKTAKKASKLLGINMSTSITLTKPSGSVSQLVDSSSGIHPRFSKFYIRRYRIAAVDPLCKMMISQNITLTPENGQRPKDWKKAQKETDIQKAKSICPIYDPTIEKWSKDLVNTWIISFPIKSPKTAITSDQVTAMEQLEMYKKVQTNWCEHNASITVYVKPDEWIKVGNWVYENWDIVNGLSFIPYQEHVYEQAPYEVINEEQYKELVDKFKEIDYTKLSEYEIDDETQGSKEYACIGGSCDV